MYHVPVCTIVLLSLNFFFVPSFLPSIEIDSGHDAREAKARRSMAGMPSEDGLFLSATAMQWQALQKERATSVRSILKAVLNDDAYRERIPGAPPGSVLKRSLFAWCKDVGLGLHLHLEEAVSAGYLIQGGENPQEWLCVVPDWQPPIWEQGQGAQPC